MTRHTLLTLALAVLATGPIILAAAQGPGAEATLRDLEQQLAAAWVKGDRAFIDGLLSPDWTVTDQSGRVLTKKQVLAEAFESTDRKIESMVTGRTRATGSYRGTSATAQLRFTDVFVFERGRWQIVASHGTLIAP